MSRWKQWVRPPEGALPGGIVTKAGIALMGVLVAGLLFSWSLTGPQETDTAVVLPEPQAVDEGMGRALEGRIRAETERQTQQAAAEARAEFARRQAAAAEEAALADTESEASGVAFAGEAEAELREALRLDEIERRTRSLRSEPVAHSYRGPGGVRSHAAPTTGDVGEPEFIEDALEGTLTSSSDRWQHSRTRSKLGWRAPGSHLARRQLPPGPPRRIRSGWSARTIRRAGNGSTRARSSRPCS